MGHDIMQSGTRAYEFIYDIAGAGLETHQHCQLEAGKVHWRYSTHENENKKSEHILRPYCRNVPGITETKKNPMTT